MKRSTTHKILILIIGIGILNFGCKQQESQSQQQVQVCPHTTAYVQHVSDTTLMYGDMLLKSGTLGVAREISPAFQEQLNILEQIGRETGNNSLCIEQNLIVRRTYTELGRRLAPYGQ